EPGRHPLRMHGDRSAHHRDRFDLDQAPMVVAARDLHQRHGRVVAPEVVAVDRADVPRAGLVVALREHVDGQLDDVVHLARAGHQHRFQVLAHLAELGDQVARAHDVALLVERDLARDVDRLAALGLPAVGIAGRLDEGRRVDGLCELGHGFLPGQTRVEWPIRARLYYLRAAGRAWTVRAWKC